MNQKFRTIDGVKCWTFRTYAAFFVGKSYKDVEQAEKDGRIASKRKGGHRYAFGLPPASWVLKDPAVFPWVDQPAAAPSEPPAGDPTPAKKSPATPRRIDLNAEKARKMAAEAELAELKLAKEKSKLYERVAETVLRCIRAGFNKEVVPFLYDLNLKKLQVEHLARCYDKAFDEAERLYLEGTEPDDDEDAEGEA